MGELPYVVELEADALLEVKTLGRELAAQRAAAAATTEAVELATLRYEKGLVSYLEVVDAERTRLQASAGSGG